MSKNGKLKSQAEISVNRSVGRLSMYYRYSSDLIYRRKKLLWSKVKQMLTLNKLHASGSRDATRNTSMSVKEVVIRSLFTEPFLITSGFFPLPPTLFGPAQCQSDILDEMGKPGATALCVLC